MQLRSKGSAQDAGTLSIQRAEEQEPIRASLHPPAPPCIHPLSGAWGRPLNKGGRSVGIALPSFYNFKLREINWDFSDAHLWSGKFIHEWFSSVLR